MRENNPQPESATAKPLLAKKEDGRTLRSATTRLSVAEAYLNLLSSGDLRPTAKAIATEAGVSERAVFRHFQDMDTLHSEAAVLQIQRVSREIPDPAPSSGRLVERASLLAMRWCALNERVTPVRRVALLHEPFAPEVARRLSWVRELARTELEHTFIAELDVLGEEARRRKVAALCVAMSWEAWNEIRQRQRLEIDAARETVASMMMALLSPSPAI